MGELLPCLLTGEHLWGGLGDYQSSGVGRDGGRCRVSWLPSVYLWTFPFSGSDILIAFLHRPQSLLELSRDG